MRAALPALLAWAAGCSAVRSPDPAPPVRVLASEVAGGFGAEDSLALDPNVLRAAGASPELLAKLSSSAYRYFRRLGPQIASRTCWAFRDVRWQLPMVAIHGDAHVEQFVVTAATYGLEDFDQAGFGPAVVDLVRYAASLHLACRDRPWSCRADEAVAAYLAAYRAALDREPDRSQPPPVVARLRAAVAQDRAAWLAWADGQMRDVAVVDVAGKRARWQQFVALMAEIQPERSASFYDVVRLGRLEMGIGSAMDQKLLVRVAGETAAADDDLILEARSSRSGTGGCAWRPAHGGSMQSLMFMSLLGPRMPEVFGFAPLADEPAAPEFWVQSWDPGYRELSLDDLHDQADLEALAVDGARQLAGHFWTRFPEPLRPYQRHVQLEAFDLVHDRVVVLARSIAAEVVDSWETFRDAHRARR